MGLIQQVYDVVNNNIIKQNNEIYENKENYHRISITGYCHYVWLIGSRLL